jgi:hypothetical protein
MGEERKVYKVLVGKPEGRRPLGRPRHRWEDGVRMDLRDIGLGCVDWIRLVQERNRWRAVASAVMNLRVLAPQRVIFFSLSDVRNMYAAQDILCFNGSKSIVRIVYIAIYNRKADVKKYRQKSPKNI